MPADQHDRLAHSSVEEDLVLVRPWEKKVRNGPRWVTVGMSKTRHSVYEHKVGGIHPRATCIASYANTFFEGCFGCSERGWHIEINVVQFSICKVLRFLESVNFETYCKRVSECSNLKPIRFPR